MEQDPPSDSQVSTPLFLKPSEVKTIMSEYVDILLMIPVMLISLTVHEYSHARAAYAMGDPTARNLGRMTLNPIKHIDPLGALCMVLFQFGWAKPVPISTRNFKKPRAGMAVSSVAGPISNLLLAFLGAILTVSALAIRNELVWNGTVVTDELSCRMLDMLIRFLLLLHYANITLAVFNLIPIPPLDGSRVLTLLLPPNLYWKLMQYEQYFGLVLMALVLLGSFSGVLSVVTGWISNGMFSLLRNLPFWEGAYHTSGSLGWAVVLTSR